MQLPQGLFDPKVHPKLGLVTKSFQVPESPQVSLMGTLPQVRGDLEGS